MRDVGEFSQVRVGRDLEGQRRERLAAVGLPDDGLITAGLGALDAVDIQRRGQVGHDRVEHGLDALFLKAEPVSTGVMVPAMVARRIAAMMSAAVVLVEERLGKDVVGIREGLQQLLTPLGRGVGEVRGDLLDLVVLALLRLARPHQGLHGDEVDDAEEVGLGADRDLQHKRVALSRSMIMSTHMKKLAPVRSSLLTKQMRGTLYRSA